MKKERESGIELLRIIAIFLVIGVHALYYGHFFSMAKATGGHVYSSTLLFKFATRSAVNIFVMISGFFMIHSPFDVKKSLKRATDTYAKILFYSVVLTIIFLILGPKYCMYGNSVMPTVSIIGKGLFPITGQVWYFLSNYLFLCILSPFINLCVQKITKKEYALLLGVLTFIMCIWMNIYRIAPFKNWVLIFGYGDIPGGKNIFFFIYLYLVGGFIGRFQKKRERPNVLYVLLAGASLIINYLLHTRLDKAVGYRKIAINYTNLFVVIFAVSLLLIFKDLRFKSKIVNVIASTTIGAYAVPEFYFVRNIVWTVFDFRKYDFSNLWLNFLRLGLAILAVFALGSVADLLRQQIFRLVGFIVHKIKKEKIT